MEVGEIKKVLEAALLAAGRPLSVDDMHKLFKWGERPDKKLMRTALKELADDYAERAIELKEVASGFRVHVRPEYSDFMEGLAEERKPRYSRALLETLALIAYRQPITRGEIEDIRGVAVSSNIIRTLLEREWVRGVGHRDVPGKPEMFGTTKSFLDYFNLKRLDDLPALSELTDIESLKVQLDLPEVEGKLVTEAGEPDPDRQPTELDGSESDTAVSSIETADAEEPDDQNAAGTEDAAASVDDDAANPAVAQSS